jgi:hypothetical protein
MKTTTWMKRGTGTILCALVVHQQTESGSQAQGLEDNIVNGVAIMAIPFVGHITQ